MRRCPGGHGDRVFLEGAPVPVPGHAGCDLGRACVGEGRAGCHRAAAGDGAGWSALAAHLLRHDGGTIVVTGDGSLVRAGAGVVAGLPGEELGEAVAAGARGGAAGVVVAVLVEADGVGGVRVAEDVTTLAAVVPADEVPEGTAAASLVTCRGFVVGLNKRLLDHDLGICLKYQGCSPSSASVLARP